MSRFALLQTIASLPPAYDQERSELGLQNLQRVAEQSAGNGSEIADFVSEVVRDPAGQALLAGVFGNSPFLSRALVREAAFLPKLFGQPAEATLADILATASDAWHDEVNAMSALRVARRRVALVVALADIAGIWSVDQVTEALSRFADAAVRAAVRDLLLQARNKGELDLYDDTVPERGSGLAIIGMGKYGAFELNYSSDIDIIIFFDQDLVNYTGKESAQACFVRLAKGLVRLLQEPTADGYVFRTDLRLRPDPGATPAAMSMLAAEQYYESLGQNWERAAMIKARAVAGDIIAGEAFLERLEPFVWRRNLDFAAIQDVHSIKRQIHSHRGHAEIAVEGHNIKLGRGGIRDIEFFVQTQQLIAGGRDPSLRDRTTAGGMRALSEAGWITADAAKEMMVAYRFHRRVEHHLQMIADEQTHSLPKSADGIDHVARFLGYADTATFRDDLLAQLGTVQQHYAALFETAPALSEGGNLVFTGTDDDPETLETLSALGFEEPANISTSVRGWHHGRYRAVRSARAREILTDLMPAILKAISGSASPDATCRPA